MQAEDYSFVCNLVQTRSGITLGPDKLYLVESRLLPVAKKRGCKGIEELVQILKTNKDDSIAYDVTEAMTTNETFFFRDTKPFDQFRKAVLPHILQKNTSGKIRIWSAASSTGQEAYSIAMCIREEGAKTGVNKFEITGTDISNEVIKRAQAGVYSQFEVQRGLPVQMLLRYFTKDNENWVIKDELKSMVTYQFLNLLGEYTTLGKFDYVLCRNVLIYFNDATKRAILDKIARQMNPWGLLVLGGSETVMGITDKFQPFGEERSLFCLK